MCLRENDGLSLDDGFSAGSWMALVAGNNRMKESNERAVMRLLDEHCNRPFRSGIVEQRWQKVEQNTSLHELDQNKTHPRMQSHHRSCEAATMVM